MAIRRGIAQIKRAPIPISNNMITPAITTSIIPKII